MEVAQWQDLEGSEKAANCTDENRTSIAATYNRTGVVMLKRLDTRCSKHFGAHTEDVSFTLW